MLHEFMTWISTLSPGWIFLIFPLMFGLAAFSEWRMYRKRKKLEANPIRMTDVEYRRFNNKRFSK